MVLSNQAGKIKWVLRTSHGSRLNINHRLEKLLGTFIPDTISKEERCKQITSPITPKNAPQANPLRSTTHTPRKLSMQVQSTPKDVEEQSEDCSLEIIYPHPVSSEQKSELTIPSTLDLSTDQTAEIVKSIAERNEISHMILSA